MLGFEPFHCRIDFGGAAVLGRPDKEGTEFVTFAALLLSEGTRPPDPPRCWSSSSWQRHCWIWICRSCPWRRSGFLKSFSITVHVPRYGKSGTYFILESTKKNRNPRVKRASSFIDQHVRLIIHNHRAAPLCPSPSGRTHLWRRGPSGTIDMSSSSRTWRGTNPCLD